MKNNLGDLLGRIEAPQEEVEGEHPAAREDFQERQVRQGLNRLRRLLGERAVKPEKASPGEYE